MTYSPEHNQEVLRHLLSFLDPEFENADKLKVQSCLTEMLEVPIDMWRISKELEPYKDDVFPVLVEAVVSDVDQIFMKVNAITALEIIGDHRVLPPILENFDKLFEAGSIIELLKKIAAREDAKTTDLIVDRLVEYLAFDRKIDRIWKEKYEHDVWKIINTLLELDELTNQQLPAIMEKHINTGLFSSPTFQTALLALSKIDSQRAVSLLARKIEGTQINLGIQPKKHMRVVSNDREDSPDSAYFTICVRDNNQSELEELAYTFKHERELVYFLNEGREDGSFKLLAGAVSNKNNAIKTSMSYLETFLPEIKFVPEKYKECSQILSRHFDFETQGFFQSQIFSRAYPLIIYDSQWCRVKFAFNSSGDRYDFSTHLHVYYGRLHAPSTSEQNFMIWNGEKRWCWHRVDYALNFLDGLSPEEAVKVEYQPRVIDEYRQSDLAKKLSGMCQAEWMAGMESEVWKYYRQRLFELFDIRRSDLWEQYTGFINEFYKLKKRNHIDGGYYPPYEKIC